MMKTLLVITGMIAGLSAAHAAEKDDLVSVFKTVCMGQRPFVKSLSKFAKSRGLPIKFEQGEGGVKRPKVSAQVTIAPVSVSPEAFGSTKQAATSLIVHAVGGLKFEGSTLEFCSVSQDGFSMQQLSTRVESELGLSGSGRVSSTAPLGREGPQLQSMKWDLVSRGWDYISLNQTDKPSPQTRLLRSSETK